MGTSESKLMNVQIMNRGLSSSYAPLFTPEFEEDISTLVSSILQTVYSMKMKPEPDEVESQDGSFWSSIWKPTAGDENVFDHSLRQPLRLSGGIGSSDRMSVMRQLEESARFWSSMFELDMRKISASVVQNRTARRNLGSSLNNGGHNNYPDHKMGKLGPELTEKGRWQIMTGKRRFNLTYAGDPDLQPVRSFEFAFLVQLALYLSNKINAKYTEEIERLYDREDFVGKFLKNCVLCGPLKFSPQKMAPAKCIENKTNEFTFKPHVSLRALASYSSLFYFSVVVCLCFLLLPNWVVFGALLAAIVVPFYALKVSRNYDC